MTLGMPDLTEITWRNLRTRLVRLYGGDRADDLVARIAMQIHKHILERSQIMEGPLWSERDSVLITYGDSIQVPGDLPLNTLQQFLSENLGEVITTVHLLPFYPYSSDDGFSVIDYQSVDPVLGGWQQVHDIGEGFDLMFDLVLNHVSRESLWFNDYLEHMPPGKDFFIEVDPTENLASVVRPRSSPLLVEIRTRHDERHVWATFSHDQIDLNYRNPDVLLAMIEILLSYIRQGARILRLDAVAFLWKQIGTSCVHLPETHEIVKLFRDILDDLEPGCVLLTETNVPHKENISYFGEGDEAHMVYQFALPPLLVHALHTGNTQYLADWLRGLDPPPEKCTYLNFTASHDGIGLRPLEGIVPHPEVGELLDSMRARGGFVSMRLNTEGMEIPYELNITYFDAMDEGDGDEAQMARFLLSQTLALSLQGVPAIYIHSLFATHNDMAGLERSGRIRSINRRKWDVRELQRMLCDPDSIHTRVFDQYRHRIAVRAEQPAFHPNAPQRLIDTGEGILCFDRVAVHGQQRIICLFNFSRESRCLALTTLSLVPTETLTDLLSDTSVKLRDDSIDVPPYGCRWISC